jgi:hypothetical protein
MSVNLNFENALAPIVQSNPSSNLGKKAVAVALASAVAGAWNLAVKACTPEVIEAGWFSNQQIVPVGPTCQVFNDYGSTAVFGVGVLVLAKKVASCYFRPTAPERPVEQQRANQPPCDPKLCTGQKINS